MKNILITGCSSGFGLALCEHYLQQGYKVYGIARTQAQINHPHFTFYPCDLSKVDAIQQNLNPFLSDIGNFELVFLNAGMLGKIKSSLEVSVDELHQVYALNVYANKELLDMLSTMEVKTIIGISSGASKNGSKGWASYSLSKAGLNMLINLYSKEMPHTKLLAVAPGVIETPMTDYIRFDIDETKFPSAKILKSGEIQTPSQAVLKMEKLVQRADRFESGLFIDVRNI